jgi:hypothetical protein
LNAPARAGQPTDDWAWAAIRLKNESGKLVGRFKEVRQFGITMLRIEVPAGDRFTVWRVYQYDSRVLHSLEMVDEAFVFAHARALAEASAEGRRFRHLKRGSTYTVVGRAELQSAVPIAEGAELTIYRCEGDDRLWARPTAEFTDGRFVEIKT